jgi:GT2 family glycosyltransferase
MANIFALLSKKWGHGSPVRPARREVVKEFPSLLRELRASTDEEFVTLLYLLFLDRLPGRAESDNWLVRQDGKPLTRRAILSDIANSPEARNRSYYVNQRLGFESAYLARCEQELQDFLARNARLRFSAPSRPGVSIIAVLRGPPAISLGCLRSVLDSDVTDCDLTLVDSSPQGASDELLARIDGASVQRGADSIAARINTAAAHARGDYLLFLRDGARLQPNAMRTVAEGLAADPEAGVAGGLILGFEGKIIEAGGAVLGNGGTASIGQGREPDESGLQAAFAVDCVSSAFLLTRRELFLEIGGFDPLFGMGDFGDVDYCRRAWAATRRVLSVPQARLCLLASSAGTKTSALARAMAWNRSRLLFCERYGLDPTAEPTASPPGTLQASPG